MISWTEGFFIGDKIRKKKNSVISSIKNGEVTFDVYCIIIASHKDNLFDIVDANELLFPFYQSMEVRIVGLAKGRREAYQLVERMILEIYRNTGNFDVRAYFT